MSQVLPGQLWSSEHVGVRVDWLAVVAVAGRFGISAAYSQLGSLLGS